MGILFRNAELVTASGQYRADLLVEGEIIHTISAHIPAHGHTVIDCAGLYLLPGGVDVHTHLHLPLAHTASNSDFVWGHRAAAFGGTTTHIDFVSQPKGGTLADGLALWHDYARPATIDYGFHMTLTDPRPEVLAEIPSMRAAGINTIKILMAYKGSFMVDDTALFQTMQVCAANGLMVLAHCENGDVEALLRADLLARDQTTPRAHPLSRPAAIEAEATNRAIMMSQLTGCPLYIVHMTCAGAVEALRRGRQAGVPVMGETCPQYLCLTADALDTDDFSGAKFVCSPPLRTHADQAALWAALRDGTLHTVATDHCDFWYAGSVGPHAAWAESHTMHEWAAYEAQNPAYRRPGKELGRDDFSRIPNGLPGIENRLHLLWHEGVNGGRLTPSQVVALACTTPARIFGLAGRKGDLVAGADADLVLWNPRSEHTLSAATHHMRTDYTPYEGKIVVGAPEQVWRRGVLLVEGGTWRGEQGTGRYLARAGECQVL